jgi:peptide/nickel transport system ATP-binding protein
MGAVALLEVRDLHTEIRLKRSTVYALGGVDLTVDAGETLGVVGESGCGKTMTAMSIMRLLPNGGSITAGSVALDGRELTNLSNDEMSEVRGNEIGMIFQDPMSSLNPTMTIGMQIAESVLLHRHASKQEALERAVETLKLVGMPSAEQRAKDYPHQLSGGMRQRAMIAMALACEPKLLIADEPTTALDVTVQKQILGVLNDLKERLGMAVILVTHDLGVIAGSADRVAVMYAGKVVETTDTKTLFGNSRHPYTEALFDALPEKAAETGGRLYSIPGLPPDLTAPPQACRFADRCRNVQDRCRTESPELAGETTLHQFACFYPTGSAERSADGKVVAVAEAPEHDLGERIKTEVRTDAGPVLQVTNLVKDFPITAGLVLRRRIGAVSAVADVSFEIYPGETFGLVGESGCGKSTIGRLLVGLETASSGKVQFEQRELTGQSDRQLRPHRKDIQLMFQDSYASLDPRMRVRTILTEPLNVQHIGDRAARAARVRELVDAVGLPQGALDRYPHEFSGGQRQRIGFARALALNPKMIVADEPVSALDVSIQSQVLNLMKELQRDLGLTYLFISHDLSVVRYLSDRIGVMYLGKLVEIGPAESVYTAPVHHYTRGLLDAVPVADPNIERAKEDKGVVGELPSAINPPSGCRFRTRCPAAQSLCAEQEPPLVPFGPDNHFAACHFPLRGASAGLAANAGPVE